MYDKYNSSVFVKVFGIICQELLAKRCFYCYNHTKSRPDFFTLGSGWLPHLDHLPHLKSLCLWSTGSGSVFLCDLPGSRNLAGCCKNAYILRYATSINNCRLLLCFAAFLRLTVHFEASYIYQNISAFLSFIMTDYTL